jgi:hypothetical protein
MGPDELATFKLVLAALLMAYVEVRGQHHHQQQQLQQLSCSHTAPLPLCSYCWSWLQGLPGRMPQASIQVLYSLLLGLAVQHAAVDHELDAIKLPSAA